MDFKTEDWKLIYKAKKELLENQFKESSSVEFYRDLFPKGSLQKKGELFDEYEIDCPYERKGNIIATSICKDDKKKTRNWIVTDDLEDLKYVQGVEFGLIAPVSWWGKSHKKANAHELFAFGIDIDYVNVQCLKNLLKQFRTGVQLPPSYLVSSGKGLHLYYFLDKPIPLYSNLIDMLCQLKKDLIRRLWNDTSSLKPERPDITGIFQGFRSVGCLSKLGPGYLVRAYKISGKRYSLEELAKMARSNVDVSIVDKKPEWKPKKDRISLEEALEKYPDWYERKILKKEKPQKIWHSNSKLYEWWKGKIMDEVKSGGRYYSLMALCSFGRKCGISDEQIKSDAWGFLNELEKRTDDETNHFTERDVEDALESLKNPKIALATREWISEHTKVEIKPNKRRKKPLRRDNGDALKAARVIQNIQDPEGTWRGRKSAESDFYNYLMTTNNPSCAEFCEKTGRKKSVWYKYKKNYEDENRLAYDNHISKFYDTAPDGTKIEFIAE
ncbi:MAG: hypothetical protein IJZ71_09630 [Treponema sp.]|nr:hypothetical protein [Spirochaetaceae bacterium]MBQ8777731.1 hypothetical protein [Treponema sp.]